MIEQVIQVLKNVHENELARTLVKTFAKYSTQLQEFDILGKCAFDLKDYKMATLMAEKVVELANQEQIYDAKCNLANALVHCNYPEKTLEIVSELETLIPDNKELQLKKSYAYFLLGDRDKAEQILRQELDSPTITNKTKTEINFNLGTYELYRDNFQEGLRRFLLIGREMGVWKKPRLPFKMWNGEDIEGKTLVLRTEAGIGDEFINIRFMKHLKEKGINPVWLTERKDLKEVFNRNGYKTISDINELIFIDGVGDLCWCHSMDLPILLNLEYKDLWYGPYITSSNNSNIHPFLQNDNIKKIGIRWQGNPYYENDLHRTIPLSQLMDVLDEDYHFDIFSLQKDEGIEELNEYPHVVNLNDSYLNNWEQTLDCVNKLDVVITSCTSIAHASAAMGKRTFVFVSLSSYYVWCHSMKQSPWYGDNVTLLRQVKPRSWKEPMNELKQYLKDEFDK